MYKKETVLPKNASDQKCSVYRRKHGAKALAFLLATSLLLTACGGGNGSTEGAVESSGPVTSAQNTTWQYTPTIPEPITQETQGGALVLGDFNNHGIEFSIPEGAFSSATKITMSHPEEDVNFSQETMDPAGVPVSLLIEGDQLRSDLPIRVKVKVDAAALQNLEETEGYKGVHYHEDMGWTYKNPVEINVAEGYVVYETYHNFLFGSAELTEEERIEEYVKNKAMEQWGAKQMGDEVENVTREMVMEIMRTQFNANNESEIAKIAEAVVGELDLSVVTYGQLAMDMKNGDYAAVTDTVAGMLGSKLAESMESGTLETLFGSAGTAAAAAGHLWEGDFSGAGRKLGEAIAENTMVVKVAKVWIDVVDTKINNWRNDEVEKAYQIFVNGATSRIPWGYNVEAGNFDDLYDQMRGVARQIEIDAINRYASVEGINPNDVPEEKRRELRQEAKESLREQFEARSQQEVELRQLEEDQREIVRQLDEWGLLKKGSSWYPYSSSVEQMLHRLHGQMEKIMREVGRYDLVIRRGDLHDQSRGLDNIGELKKSEILVEHLAELINTRYVYGEEEYQKKLIEMGYKTLELEAGTYSGELIITETPVVKGLRDALENPEIAEEYDGPNSEYCEEIDLLEAGVQEEIRNAITRVEEMKGVAIPLTIRVTKGQGDNNYSATLKADFDSAFPGQGCEDISEEGSMKVNTKDDIVSFTQAIPDAEGLWWQYDATILLGGKLDGIMMLAGNAEEFDEYIGTSYLIKGTWSAQKQ